MTFIPNSVKEITVDWLNSVLPAEMQGIQDMQWEDLGEGVGILGEVSRLHLTYREGASGPKTIIAKCQSPAPENIFLCQAMGFYFREVNFYQKLTDTLPVKVPRCYYSDIANDGIPFVLLIQEISDISILDQSKVQTLIQPNAYFLNLLNSTLTIGSQKNFMLLTGCRQ